MIEAIAQLPVGFFIALSGVLIPGPLLAFIVLKTPSCGPKTGTFAAVGHIFVEFGILALIVLGFGFVLESKLFQTAMGLIGGGLLFALGLLYVIKLIYTPLIEPRVIGLKHHPVLGGVLFSTVLNPSVPLWWATIGVVTLMDAVLTAALVGVIFWLIGHFLADLGWFSFVSYSVAKGKRVIGQKAHVGLMVACGCILLVFGAYFVVRYGLPLLA